MTAEAAEKTHKIGLPRWLRRVYWKHYLVRYGHRHPYRQVTEHGHDAWLVLHADVFRSLLDRARAGEDPELLYVEFVANSETENYQEED